MPTKPSNPPLFPLPTICTKRVRPSTVVIRTIWVFNKWDDVQTKEENQAYYCPGSIHYFSVALVTWQWINITFLVVCKLLGRFCKSFFRLLCC